MRKIVQIITLTILIFAFSATVFSQEKISNLIDGQLKESLYNKYKKEVQAYDKKQFDTLFFDFFSKQSDKKITLTKEEYYTFTVKIAIYSEKLGLLYKEQKVESLKAKQDWLEKNYQEYLDSKK
ncbi:hypothetical protein [Flavobacterium sp.]|uniref:hypothetical protein n=1 Tax=Flavobacterium sp. TaxID=239 RepID=UPI0037526146